MFALFTLTLLLIMARPLKALIAYAMDTKHSHASQIVLVPFVTAGLIYLNRKNIFRAVQYSIVPGAVVILLGLGLLVAALTLGNGMKEGNHLALWTSSTVVLWLGGFLLFYGSTAFKTAQFPLLFLVFFIPIPSVILDHVITFLRRGSAEMAYLLLKYSGTPVLRESTYLIRMPDLLIEVAEECSGIRSGISMLISGLLAGHLFLRTTWKKVFLVLVSIPVLIFKNALRIGTLSYLAVHVDKRILTSQLHREGGIPFFVLGLLLLYPVLLILMKSEKKTTAAGEGTDSGLEPTGLPKPKMVTSRGNP